MGIKKNRATFEPEEKDLIIHAVSASYNTSTYGVAIAKATRDVRGIGKDYNPDVIPYQHHLLKRTVVNTRDSVFREDLLKSSELLKKHTYSQIWKIVAEGWTYVDNEGNEMDIGVEWDEELEDYFIDALSKALVIDSAAICRFGDGSYRVFTSSEAVDGHVYGDAYKNITEIYFRFYNLDNLIAENSEAPYVTMNIGFLTQHSKEEEKRNRLPSTELQGNEGDMIYKDCVLITPKPSNYRKFGDPYYEVEVETATQKIYLRSMEFAHTHKGGVDKVLAFPDDAKDSVKEIVLRENKRGIWSQGYAFGYQNAKSAADLFFVSETQYPDLHFDTINSHISEESELTKQNVEGAAQTGAMGGQAPVVNKQTDDENKDSLQYICAKVIKDINATFFNVEKYTTEKIDGPGNRVRRIPAYHVQFNDPVAEQELMAEEERKEDREGEKANTDKDFELKEKEIEKKYSESNEVNNSCTIHGCEIHHEVILHSVVDTAEVPGFVTYTGNMFQAGYYLYPKLGKGETFSKEDIKAMTQRPVRTGYIEVDHSQDYVTSALDEGVGYYEMIGFDEEQGMDITKWHIREEENARLEKEGHIKTEIVNGKEQKLLKVSPKFHRKTDQNTGRKKIFVKNAAIVTKGIARSELTGLKTQIVRSN